MQHCPRKLTAMGINSLLMCSNLILFTFTRTVLTVKEQHLMCYKLWKNVGFFFFFLFFNLSSSCIFVIHCFAWFWSCVCFVIVLSPASAQRRVWHTLKHLSVDHISLWQEGSSMWKWASTSQHPWQSAQEYHRAVFLYHSCTPFILMTAPQNRAPSNSWHFQIKL